MKKEAKPKEIKDTTETFNEPKEAPKIDPVELVRSRLSYALKSKEEKSTLFSTIQRIYRAITEEREDDRANIFIPECFSEVEQIQAKATSNRPKIDLTALDKEAEKKIEDAEQVVDKHWDKMQMDRRLPLWVKVDLKFGTGVSKLTWANEKGKKTYKVRKFDNDGNVISEEEVTEGKTRYDGPKFEIPNIMNIFPQPGTKEPSWVIEYKMIDKEDLYKNPNYDPNIIDQLSSYLTEEIYQKENIKEDNKDLSEVQGDEFSTPILVCEYWTEDRLIVTANHKHLLRDTENPYGEMPYIWIWDQEDDQDFWGIGEIEMNVGPQQALNTLESQIIEANNLRLKRPFVYDMKAEIDIDQLERGWEAGNGIGYNKKPGDAQVPISFPDVPDISQSADSQAERMKGYMQSSTSANDFTAGSLADVSQNTARGAAMMTDNNNDRFRQKIRNIEAGIRDIGEKILRYDVKFRTTDVVIPSTDEDGKTKYKKIKPFSQDINAEVIVEAGSTLPVNKQEKRMQEMGFIKALSELYPEELQNPKVKESFYEAFEKDPDKYIEKQDETTNAEALAMSPDIEEQEAEDTVMANGKYVEPLEDDDHEVHLKIIEETINSADFSTMPPEIQNLYIKHQTAHQNMLGLMQRGGMNGQETGQIPEGAIQDPEVMGGAPMPTEAEAGVVPTGNPGIPMQ
jgi:hypothetical protein